MIYDGLINVCRTYQIIIQKDIFDWENGSTSGYVYLYINVYLLVTHMHGLSHMQILYMMEAKFQTIHTKLSRRKSPVYRITMLIMVCLLHYKITLQAFEFI